MKLQYRFLPKLCTALVTALLLSGCTEVLSFSVGFGAGFFTGMQYQKSQIKGENSVYMGNESAASMPQSGAMNNSGYPNTGGYADAGGSMDYYASGIPSDPYNNGAAAGTYPPPAPVYSAPVTNAPPPPQNYSAQPQGYPPPAAPQPYYNNQSYGMAPPVQTYGGGYYAPQQSTAPAPFATQGNLRPSAYSYAAPPPSTYGW